MDKNRVFIARCEDYNHEIVADIVSEGISQLFPNGHLCEKGRKVLLKPNLLSESIPEKAVTTHPEIVKGVGIALKKLGFDIELGDSPGASLASIEHIWETTGMREAADFIGAKLVNFNSFKVKEHAVDFKHTKSVKISDVCETYDAVINIPKMKTHSMMTFTGAIKNLFGLVPGFMKVNCHKTATKPKDFAEILVKIYQSVKPKLHILDGVVAMEGRGPQGGTPKKMNVIIMGTDSISVDLAMTYLMGVNHEVDPTFSAFRRLGVDVPSFSDLEILGDDIKSFLPDTFELSQPARVNSLPTWFSSFVLKKFMWVYPLVIEDKCTKCGVCKKGCPVDAITVTKELTKIDRKKCISCFCCTEVCTYHAFKYDYSWLAAKFIRMKPRKDYV